jgi:hypothetical protein
MAQLTVAKVRSTLAVDPTEVRDRLKARLATTPGRLNAYLVALTVLGVLVGLVAVVGAVQRADRIDGVANRTGPLAVQAQQLYRSLSDADATAAAAFLSSAAEPAFLRLRYQSDIADASAALASAAASAGTSGPVARISAALPVYTGLIETARTQNRLNLPVGAAYLREASALMRTQLLPAADELYRTETDQLNQDLSAGSVFPWLTVPLILALLVGLWLAQRYLAQRTQRLVNRGLAVATAATVVLLLWVGLSWVDVAGQLSAARSTGAAQVDLLAQARIAALQARADEALTLVARGSGGAFEDDFKARFVELTGGSATSAGGAGIATGGVSDLLGQARAANSDPDLGQDLDKAAGAVTDWRAKHTQLRAFDDSGQYPDAVTLAVDKDGTTAAFNKVDGVLGDAIARADRSFRAHASSADGAMTGSAVGWTLLTIIAIAGLVLGLRQRIAEYR